MKVKIFSETYPYVEKEVNTFLTDTEGKIEVLNITQSTTISDYVGVKITVMIQYKEL